MNNSKKQQEYIYTYACERGERSLCEMEMFYLFGIKPETRILKSNIEIEPSRSPFFRERIDVIFEGNEVSDIIAQVQQLPMLDSTFKVIFVKTNDLNESEKIRHAERKRIEREIGWHLKGEADLMEAEVEFGIVPFEGRWYFGKYRKSEPVWLRHQKKPREYSTALNTRVARAVANIAVPNPDGIKAIDPCCGIGTVLVEALSMGIDIVGRDINYLAASGARENIAYFNLEADVKTGPISAITNSYDVAIIDLPYNLYTSITPEEQAAIIQQTRRIADKAVIITIETIDRVIEEAGFEIEARCEANKGHFSRQILVCG
ncbi:TRM11 family SAM-dependent methyltransferase [Peribacillus faecalis]|nr:RNA methyltransferase [Peribacillus faecalis]